MLTVHEDKIRKWLDCKSEKMSVREGFERTYSSTADSYTDWLLMTEKKCKSKHMQELILRWNQLLLAIYARTEPYRKDEIFLWTQLESIAMDLERREKDEELKYILVGTDIPENKNDTSWRKETIRQIADAFREQRCVYLCGDSREVQGGAAIEYARKYAERYETVVFAACEGGLQKTIADDEKIRVANLKYNPVGKRGEQRWYFKRKMKILSEITDERTLLILDGVDGKVDKRLEEVVELPCHLLFTGVSIARTGELASIEL